MIKIGIIDTINEKGINLLKNNKNFSYEIVTDISKENLLKQIPKFDGITLRRGKIDSEILNQCRNLKVISRHGVGYDNVDTQSLKEKNIKLLVAHNSTSTSPSEHAMFMILNIYKGRGMFDKMVREGNFNKALYLKIDDNFELLGKTVLIVGFGRIGRKLIKKCLGFDMNVIVFDPNVHGDEIKSFGGLKVNDLNDALKNCDILSLSLPFNKDTKDLIKYENLSLMRKNAIVINIARGGIINEDDLNRALNENIIYFAGIDVFAKEPPSKDNPLLKNPRVLLSPHAATFTKEGLEKMSLETVQNLIDYFEDNLDPVKVVKT